MGFKGGKGLGLEEALGLEEGVRVRNGFRVEVTVSERGSERVKIRSGVEL